MRDRIPGLAQPAGRARTLSNPRAHQLKVCREAGAHEALARAHKHTGGARKFRAKTFFAPLPLAHLTVLRDGVSPRGEVAC